MWAEMPSHAGGCSDETRGGLVSKNHENSSSKVSDAASRNAPAESEAAIDVLRGYERNPETGAGGDSLGEGKTEGLGEKARGHSSKE